MIVAQRRILHSQMSISVFCKECGSFLPGSGSSGRARRERDPDNSVLLPGGEPVWQVQGSGARVGYSAASGNVSSCLDNFPFGKFNVCRFIPLILQKEGSKTGNKKAEPQAAELKLPIHANVYFLRILPRVIQDHPITTSRLPCGLVAQLRAESCVGRESRDWSMYMPLSLHLRLNVQVVQLDFQ